MRKLVNAGSAVSIRLALQRFFAHTDFVPSKTSISRRSRPGSARPFKDSRPDTLAFMLSTLSTDGNRCSGRRDSAEEPRVPVNWFGIILSDKRKLRMQWVEDDIAFSSLGDDTWYSKDRGSVFLDPSISESPRGGHVLRVPVPNRVDRNRLDGHITDTRESFAGNLIPFRTKNYVD